MRKILLLLSLSFLGACSVPTVPPPPIGFLPSECLVSEQLQFRRESPNQIRVYLDLANYEQREDIFPNVSSCFWPVGEAWQGIKNVASVEVEYKNTIGEMRQRIELYGTVSVFSLGGESVVADKPFMGYAPGENLMEVLGVSLPGNDPQWEALKEVLGIHGAPALQKAFPMQGFLLTLPQKGIDGMNNDEIIHFEVRFPTEAVWLLHGLDLRVESPSADIPMDTHVLHGTFLYQKGSGFRF